ncbi:hypothetical protein AHMF7616_00578 [Adhaeribacter pallidiroseus]|uniref:Uncharacterized protein n=1 Tax=Adhaeribacter pallidiroseus TaxID=2072847 RepID=A0A369QI63_9BACT|nr:hypothetical protein AHMF7616_00578 [Adhaeribacter pallidiroseus]
MTMRNWVPKFSYDKIFIKRYLKLFVKTQTSAMLTFVQIR